jgi:tRNA uridine 5-carboxymethylaminomethyl modification enzyme
VGAGHAGIEAALAAARLGRRTLLLTMNLETIGHMPCNCSIGGPAKGHLVVEIDALGGQMGVTIDRTRTHIKRLNTSKGPAVQVLRAQADKRLYAAEMKRVLENQPGLELKLGLVEDLLTEGESIAGVVTQTGMVYRAPAVVLTTGTFLNGLIHIGEVSFPAGRAGEFAAVKLGDRLRRLGLEMGRLKTGTVPRVNARSIDFSKTERQPSDDPGLRFSFRPVEVDPRPLLDVHRTHTTGETHRIIRENLHRSALYSGRIVGIGPRYCPSLEVKVVRFADQEQHPVFLELEGWTTQEVYLAGISNSLPESVQVALVHSLPGCERAEITRPGYAIEYDFVPPVQLKPSLEVKAVPGLFLAGQINGTSGYEEAAAQGLLAGVNAARSVAGQPPVGLERQEAYIGVLIDDLVTKGIDEPYRMMTSRAEHRLLLRAGNADLRLTPRGWQWGLVAQEDYERVRRRAAQVEEAITSLRRERREGRTLAEHLRTTGARLTDVWEGARGLPADVREEVEYQIKYEGYIERQNADLARIASLDRMALPFRLDYRTIRGLSCEGIERLERVRPQSIGQARRIPGLTPADLSLLVVAARRSAA